MNEKAQPATQMPQLTSEERRIVNQIYEAVLEQRLAPKTKLSEAKLCQSFSTGRMHVRRALLMLAGQGIVDLQSNRGAYVACPEPEEARRIFETRIMIEPVLASRISENCQEADIKLLRDHIDREDSARSRNERSDIIRLSGEFHVKLAEASGYQDLARFVRELVLKTSLIVGLFGVSNAANCPEDEHAQILAAIVSGETELATRLMTEHLQHIQAGLDFSQRPNVPSDMSKALGLSQ